MYDWTLAARGSSVNASRIGGRAKLCTYENIKKNKINMHLASNVVSISFSYKEDELKKIANDVTCLCGTG